MGFKKVCLVMGSSVGISLAAYWLIRRFVTENEVKDWFGLRSGGGDVIKVPSKQPSHYIRVPVYLIPRLLGNRGEVVHELQVQTRTQIHFDNDVIGLEVKGQPKDEANEEELIDEWVEDVYEPQPIKSSLMGYRLMSIRGEEEDVQRVAQMVTAMIEECTMESMVIPDGCDIVGRDGYVIRDIEDQSGAKLKVNGSKHMSHRTVLIIGNDRQRSVAKRMVNKIINDFCEESLQTIE